MKSLSLILLSLSLACCINLDLNVLAQINEKLAPIRESNTGKFIIDLATIHSELSGPVDDLVDTVNALQEDLQSELLNLDQTYQTKQNDHVRDIQVLEENIGTTEIDISNSRELLENYLKPTKTQLETKIENLGDNIEDNRATLDKESIQRDNNHELSVQGQKEHQEAIDAIDQAIVLVESLINNPASLAQTHSVTKSIKLIETKLTKKIELSPMINALLNIAQNFTNQQDVQTIVEMLNDLRNATVDSLNEEFSLEADRQNDWVDRQAAINNEYVEFQRQVTDALTQIVSLKDRIDQQNEFIQSRNSDLAAFQEQYQTENTIFASESVLYQETRPILLKEITVAQQAQEFINSADFSNYINSRINVPTI